MSVLTKPSQLAQKHLQQHGWHSEINSNCTLQPIDLCPQHEKLGTAGGNVTYGDPLIQYS